jgi:hypothetical protein
MQLTNGPDNDEIIGVINYAQSRASEEKRDWYIVAQSSCIFANSDKNGGTVLEIIKPIQEQEQ